MQRTLSTRLRVPATALMTYLLALPVTVVLASLVSFTVLAFQPNLRASLLTLSLGVFLISAALYWKARPRGVAELSLLPLQLALLLLGAFASQGTVTLLGAAAWSATLALTLPLRFALPLGITAAQVAAGILISTLGTTTWPLLATAATPLLTAFASRRTRPVVRDTLRPVVFTLTLLSVIALAVHLL